MRWLTPEAGSMLRSLAGAWVVCCFIVEQIKAQTPPLVVRGGKGRQAIVHGTRKRRELGLTNAFAEVEALSAVPGWIDSC